MPEKVDCILCDSKRKKILAKKREYTVNKCRGCGLVFVSPRATLEEQGKLYENEYMANLEITKDVLIKANKERLEFVERFKKKGSLLDIGCGMGYFLDLAEKGNWSVKGADVSHYALEYCKKHYSFDVESGENNDLPYADQKFDAVALWHVLEHLRNPLELLVKARERLADDGLLFIEVPNIRFLLEILRPAKLRSNSEVSEHFYYFSHKTMKRLLSLAGFEVKAIVLGKAAFIRTCYKEKVIKLLSFFGWWIYKLTSINLGNSIRVVASKTKDLNNANRKIKILHITGSSEWAGGEVYLKYIIQKLNKNLFELDVVCPYYGELIEKLKEFGQHSTIVDMTKLFSVRSVIKLANYIKKNNIDIVQSHGARSNFYARLTKLFLVKSKIISTVHNSLYDYPVSKIKKRVYLAADKISYYLADGIITVSKSLAEDLIDKSGYSPYKVKNIYNGVDLSKFNPSLYENNKIRNEFGLGNEPLIGLIGRMTPQKGHLYFLDAFAEVIKDFPDAKTLIVGDGEEKEKIIEKINELNLENNCILLGLREDIPEILSAIDVMVLSSISEGFPFILLEAMAMKKAIVATKVNGVVEMVKDNESALVVEPRMPEQLAEKIKILLKDENLRKNIGKNAHQVANKEFNLSKMIHDIEQYYLNLIK
ncbi:MAG: glycosyltransferase [bacterium]